MVYDLYANGMADGCVEATEHSTPLTINGKKEYYPVYRIRLDKLYYNDRNDRIATYISEYLTKNNLSKMDMSNREAYNDLMAGFITDSNPAAMVVTESSIESVGQMEPGVVLQDGRIVDGNRRYTCLRNLSKKNPDQNWFEAAIINLDIDRAAKQIKVLELILQQGVDKPVDYHPVERMIGIYNDIISDKAILSVEEYARYTNRKVKDIEDDVAKTRLMLEFLEFANAPLQFHVARDLKVDGPLVELQGILKKCDRENADRVKSAAFAMILADPDGDITRFVRQLKKITTKKEVLNEYLDSVEPQVEKVVEKVNNIQSVSGNAIRDEIRTDENLKQELSESLESAVNQEKVTSIRTSAVDTFYTAGDLIRKIDMRIVKTLDESDKYDLKASITALKKEIQRFEEKLNE